MDIARTAATRMTTAELLMAFDTTRGDASWSLIGFVRLCPDKFGVTFGIGSNRSGTRNSLQALVGARRDRVIRRRTGLLPV